MTVLRLSFPLRVEPLPFRRGTCAVPSRLVTQDESRHEKDGKRCFLPAFSHFQNDKVFGFFYSIAVTNAFLLSSVSSRRCMLSGCCGKTAKLRPVRSQAAPGGPASSGRRRRGSQRSRCPEDVGPGLRGGFPSTLASLQSRGPVYRPRESLWVPGRSNRYLGRTPVTCTKHC